jgi:hypothetical protein
MMTIVGLCDVNMLWRQQRQAQHTQDRQTRDEPPHEAAFYHGGIIRGSELQSQAPRDPLVQ